MLLKKETLLPEPPTDIRLTEKPLHSASFRSSIPDGAMMHRDKAGVLVAMPSGERCDEITRALQGLGMIVSGCTTSDQLAAFVAHSMSDERAKLPEVVVVGASLLGESQRFLELLRRADCLDQMLVLLPESWPRGVTPEGLQQGQVLQDPFPMPLLVEEVARRITPASVASAI